MNWKIDCLYFGKIKCPKWQSTPGLDTDLMLWLPVLGFLLRNGKRNILVDTGINDRLIHNGMIWDGVPVEGGEKLVLAALKKASVSCNDIDTVIYTHFHDDHAGNAHLFPKARHISQEDEWTELLQPLPHARFTYNPAIVQEIKKLNNLVVNGNFQPAPGIMCYQVPGHTLGCMALTVETASGVYVISSDVIFLKCNLYPQMNYMVDLEGNEIKITPAAADVGLAIPSFVIWDHYKWARSVSLIKALCDGPEFLLTSHDPGLANKSFQ